MQHIKQIQAISNTSRELESSFHYKILINTNKDLGFIDPLPQRKYKRGNETINSALMNKIVQENMRKFPYVSVLPLHDPVLFFMPPFQ